MFLVLGESGLVYDTLADLILLADDVQGMAYVADDDGDMEDYWACFPCDPPTKVDWQKEGF